MTESELERELSALGIPRASARLLALLPLVEVAWADGTLQDSERAVIVDAARRRFGIEGEGLALLEEWLTERPDAALVVRGRRALGALCAADGAPCQDVIPLAKQVARAAGGLFGFGAIDEEEARVIEEIAAVLRIPPQRAWALPDDPTVLHGDADAQSDGPLVKVTIHQLVGARRGPTLVHYDPDRGDQVCVVDERPISIGRADDNAIQIEFDAQVSRHHAEVAYVDGRATLRDLGSAAGTFVDGHRVDVHDLADGQTIQIGSIPLFFQAP